MQLEYTAANLTDLDRVAAQILEKTAPHQKFFLKGQMGAGKTALIQAFCKHLGVIDNVSSPTYALVHTYKTQTQGTVHHSDLYRLERLDMNMYAELEGYLYDDAYFFVEWAEILQTVLPDNPIWVEVAVENELRRITVSI
jgi:tRNA threonylcarbamoyladenosine biosynthesis protein TsaE